MNFFEHQHQARRRTGTLVLYFVLAVALILLAINAVVYAAIASSGNTPLTPEQWFGQPYWIWISLGTLVVIGFGTLKTILQLKDGGRSVAQMVGARLISGATKDLKERQLVNIVEEMSIASGTPRPELYVMDDEPAINAFVAGYRPTEAVLVVTRGTLDTMDRDELQGVIGHEYSHLLNGDMRLNIRLMGVLAGILMISQVGRLLMRSSRGGRRSKGGGQIVLIGLVLFIIGYVGLFFGALIKAAVSRQREFLADASSVQFTRNPAGILGALLRIKDHAEGSLLNNARSDDISHFCFGEAVTARFSSLIATHPPLQSRIQAIDPTLRLANELRDRKRKANVVARVAASAPAAAMGFASQGAPIAAAPGKVVESIGMVAPQHLDYARTLHNSMPVSLLAAVEETQGARNLVYALLLAGMEPAHRTQGQSCW